MDGLPVEEKTGLAFASSRLGAVHGLAYVIDVAYHIPHGRANAIMLPHVMNFNKTANLRKFGKIAEAMGENIFGLSPYEAAEKSVGAVKTLLKAGLLVSQRGTKGGYALARPPAEVPVSTVIEALEGPLAITECNVPGTCEHERRCPARPNWTAVNDVIHEALSKLTLAEMTRPAPSRAPCPGPQLPALAAFPRSITT